jgi:hypothetical protein
MPISSKRKRELSLVKSKKVALHEARAVRVSLKTPLSTKPRQCPRCKSRLQKCPGCGGLSFRNNSIIKEWEDHCSLPRCKGMRLVCARCRKSV